MITQFWLRGTGLVNVNRILLVSYTIPAIVVSVTELSTLTEPPVIVAADETFKVTAPLSMLPPEESVRRIENPDIVSVEIGFLKLVTRNATSVPPVILVEKAPVTDIVELAKAHCKDAYSTATVEQDMPP